MKCLNLSATPSTFWKSIGRAESFLEKSGDREVTLVLGGGQYSMEKTLVLDAAAWSGKKRIRMIGGERIKTVFTSLQSIPTEKFIPVAGTPYIVCQLDKDADGNYPNLRSFYVNGKLADISRTTEHRTCPPIMVDGEKKYSIGQKLFSETHKIYVPKAAIDEAGYENCEGAEFHIRVEWEFKLYHISRVDLDDSFTDDTGNVYVALYTPASEVVSGNNLSMNKRVFFIANSPAVLTKPGQYAYSRITGKLYYYPAGNAEDCSFGYGALTNLFTLKNFDMLSFESVTFTGIEDAILTEIGYYSAGQAGMWEEKYPENIFPHAGAVKIINANGLRMEKCVFTDLPCDGLSMVGILKNTYITGCRFTNIGATALRIGRPFRSDVSHWETDKIENLFIENNFVDNTGFTYENCCALIITKGRNIQIKHNTILHSSYTAISVGWDWGMVPWNYGENVNLENVEIAYNYIKSFMTNMRDGGGIYTLGGNVVNTHAAFMNTCHDNYIIEDELTCPEDGFFSSIYHDGASSNWYTANNIIIHNPARTNSRRLYLQVIYDGQDTWHILCDNNYIVGCKDHAEVFGGVNAETKEMWSLLDENRFLREKDTHIVPSMRVLRKNPEAVRIMEFSGCCPSVGKKPAR
ncbi:MAG: right-handed parallel beta-helix repeat-containing protein [Clostridia bacterium]|nr:right-handed parallel beta-helix repeat-containing protein [Clostridia bacterium]